jgi:predicted aminopeptidase
MVIIHTGNCLGLSLGLGNHQMLSPKLPFFAGASCLRIFWQGLLCLTTALFVTGCSTVGYYQQAAAGQYEVVSRQEKIPALLARTNTPAKLREKLELVLSLRQFAERELHLKTDGHYAKYADLGRRYVVWNVYAAPEFSMEPKQWWYPIVGRLKYRGFFSEKDARDCAARLAKEGYEVYVSGAEAYSTLGYFKDPVLNTFIYHPPVDLAETLFHELAHQRLFASGDTDFNEAFATVVGEEGARRWLAQNGDADSNEEYEKDLRRQRQFVALVLHGRDELKKVYERPLADEAKRAAKEQAIAQLRADYARLKASWNGYSGYDNWFERPINNARLNTVATYYKLVPAFQQLLAKHGGDLPAFYAEAKAVAETPKKQRHERLVALANAAPPVTTVSSIPAR